MKKISFLLIFTLLLVGAQWVLGQADNDAGDPEKNFEHLWKTFDRNYALFGAKGVDWNVLYNIYRPQVTAETTDEQLFTIMSNMLGHLNDNHVRLIWGQKRFGAGILNQLKRDDFSLDLVKTKYLKGKFENRVRNTYTYGWLTDSIGYFHFGGFGALEQSRLVIDEIIKEFKDARGIVVDVRFNGGGDDRVGKLIADRFADRKRLYMITRIRNGKKHDDFTPPRYWYVEPGGPIQFTKNVILLTHRFSVSAADNFSLAMRVIPHVTVVGDMTSGCFADVYGDRLPNGWRFSVSFKLFTDYSGFCWEGIGVPVDLRQTNSKEDIENKTDRVLELAVKLIESGKLVPREEPGSLEDIRESMAKRLENAIEKQGMDAALKDFYRAKKRNPDTYYIDREELDMAADRFRRAGKLEPALEVYKLNAGEHPGHWQVYLNLARACAKLGNKKAAAENYQNALKYNPRSFPWQISADALIPLEQTLAAKGIKALVSQCRALWKSRKGGLKEEDLNRWGYELFGEKRYKEAIAVFALNVEFYPGSWNTYDSLGEAYLAAGNKKLAIKNYKKSLELNPGNRGAKAVLESLKK
ncbi:MAG: tetratricopeptide repeat protein [bacterium]|nr:tetratricopeptide repeat protein [bacterium]